MNRTIRQVLLYVLLPLISGYYIYFFFRPHYWFIEWFAKREPLINLSTASFVQKIFIFSGPDFCWAFSLTSALLIWEKWANRAWKLFPYLIFLVIILSEVIQYFLSPQFTLDGFDLLAAVSGFILSYLLLIRSEHK